MSETGTNPEEVAAAEQQEAQQEAAAAAASGKEDEVVVVAEDEGSEAGDDGVNQPASEQDTAENVEDAIAGWTEQKREQAEPTVSEQIEELVNDPELSPLLGATSAADIEQEFANLVASGTVEEEDVERVQQALQRVQEMADMTIDNFIAWNEGSSLDTFLAFLANPVGTSGRGGEPLRFGSVDLGEEYGNAEVMPLHMFRALFAQPNLVGKVLVDVVKAVDADWLVTNSETFSGLSSDATPEKTKEALLKVYSELLNNNQNEEKHRLKFRAHFASELVGKDPHSETQVMDDSSFQFMFEQLDNKGERLSQLWGISE